MTAATQAHSVEETIAQGDELADMCEAFDPTEAPVYPAAEYWLTCAVQRAAVTGRRDHDRIRALVADAREAGSTWERIAELLDTTAEAAAAQYGSA